MTIGDIIGDAAAVSAAITQFTADQILLDRHFERLLRNYPNKWVGVYKQRVYLETTSAKLMKLLGKHSPHAAVKHLIKDENTLILSKK